MRGAKEGWHPNPTNHSYTFRFYGLLFYESNPYQPSIHKSISACFIRLEQRKKHFVVYVLNLEPHPFFFFNHRKERRKKGKWGLCCISPHCQQSIMGGAERWEYDYKLQWGGNKLWQSIYINIRKQWGENKLWQQIYINIRIQWGENKL